MRRDICGGNSGKGVSSGYLILVAHSVAALFWPVTIYGSMYSTLSLDRHVGCFFQFHFWWLIIIIDFFFMTKLFFWIKKLFCFGCQNIQCFLIHINTHKTKNCPISTLSHSHGEKTIRVFVHPVLAIHVVYDAYQCIHSYKNIEMHQTETIYVLHLSTKQKGWITKNINE